jgi:uroporphyrinogen-III synthase
MMSSLTGLSVLVTRPAPAGLTLCDLIKANGGNAFHFPTLAFVPTDQTLFEETVRQLGEQDWLIFISPQAVFASVPTIRRIWPHFPPQVKFAAVGAGTAKALLDAGYRASAYPTEEWSSEGLLALPEFQSIAKQKVAIIRGEGGRELLAQQLTERGAYVFHAIAYQRVIPPLDAHPVLQLLNQHQLNVAVCGSFESVKNLKDMLGAESWPLLKKLPLIVMSERVKMLAQDLGFQTILVTRNAGNDAVIELLGSM